MTCHFDEHPLLPCRLKDNITISDNGHMVIPEKTIVTTAEGGKHMALLGHSLQAVQVVHLVQKYRQLNDYLTSHGWTNLCNCDSHNRKYENYNLQFGDAQHALGRESSTWKEYAHYSYSFWLRRQDAQQENIVNTAVPRIRTWVRANKEKDEYGDKQLNVVMAVVAHQPMYTNEICHEIIKVNEPFDGEQISRLISIEQLQLPTGELVAYRELSTDARVF